MKIRCPQCRWAPDGGPHWSCDRCRESFDTFATNAQCPGCGQNWLETQCPKCAHWALHEDWFDGGPPAWQELEEDLLVGPAPKPAPAISRPGE